MLVSADIIVAGPEARETVGELALLAVSPGQLNVT